MNLKQIDAFRAVMFNGSVTRAAESLNVSQPAVTRLIRDLEYSVGFPLFERSRGSGIVPTPDAEMLLVEVEKTFAGLDLLRRKAVDIRDLRGGQLRVACLPALAMGFVPKVIQRFRMDYPETSIQLQVRSSSTVRQWVANRQFEMGLARPAPEVPGVRIEPFCTVNGVCVLPPGHRLSDRDSIAPRDLEGENFISLAMEDMTRQRIDRFFDEAGVSRNEVVETQYAATICGLVLEGIGVSIVSPFVARDFEARGVVVKPFEAELIFDYFLFLPSGRPLSRTAEIFLRKMEEQLAADRYLTQ